MGEVEDRERSLAAAERMMDTAADDAVKQFLRHVARAIRPAELTAAGLTPETPVELFTLGKARAWWAEAVSDHIQEAVAAVWRTGYRDTVGAGATTSQRGLDGYLANVTDRLSRAATPTIPEQAMDIARVALADEIAIGSTPRDVSRRLAADFGWDDDVAFWRERRAAITDELDTILDAYGPPGAPAREAVRTGRTPDPVVSELQDRRAKATRRIDAVESTWEVRANRIARTESTSAYNAGTQQAAFDEGWPVKVWMATADDRTRLSHLEASGQCVPVDAQFEVGGSLLQFPGEASGEAGETINCRCVMLTAASCEDAQARFGSIDRMMDDEYAERQGEV